jgi:hypothetical protein
MSAAAQDVNCDLTPNASDTTTTNSENEMLCAAARQAIDRKSINTLRQVIREQQRHSLVEFLRKTPAAAQIDTFVYAPPEPLTFMQFCCTCVPGKTCSAQVPTYVCTMPDNGTCPAGTLRTICEIGKNPSEDVCDSID